MMGPSKSLLQCPGQNQQQWKPEDIFDLPCPICGTPIEFWKDDVTRTCGLCEQVIPNPGLNLGCAEWCRYAKECLSQVAEEKTHVINHLGEGLQEAIRLAREALARKDLERAAMLGGLEIAEDGKLLIQMLGEELRVSPASLEVKTRTGEATHAYHELLVLRYLATEREIHPTVEWISFRDLPGGAFYHEPVAGRTTRLLLKVFGNHIEGLRAALARYLCKETGPGDLGMEIEAIGKLKILLVYRLGDEEFPPTLDLLYDRAIASVFHTDEVAALATRLCVGLIKGAASPG
jgi:hypothetical protein